MRIAAGLALLFVASMPLGASAQDYGDDARQVFRCESSDGRQRFCQAEVRGGVRIVRQLSRTACTEGDTWGVARDGVWVDRGCRAEFASSVGRDRMQARTLRCESGDGRSNFCSADTRGGVELLRQLSRSACIRGQTWDSDRRGVWVSGGCRAEFRLNGRHGDRWGGYGRDDDNGPGYPGGYSSAPERVRCESNDGRTQHCAADTRNGARLVKQLSRTACVEGQSWGFDRRGVWVTSGCRGEFETRGGWR